MTGKELRQRLEAALVRGLYVALAALPVDTASDLGGRLARAVGPRLGVSRRALRNLARAMPELDDAQRRRVLRGMWDNLGRTAGEFPHLKDMTFGPGGRIELVGVEHVIAARDDGKPGVLFSGHLANWELLSLAADHLGLRTHLIFRAANNPYLGWLYRSRDAGQEVQLIPKGAVGARQALDLLRQGEHLGMLLDQKMNDGIEVPFFGIPAMTAPAVAQFALRFDCPVLPAHIERLGGCRFRITIDPPMRIPHGGDRHADILAMVTEVNAVLERWIRARPEQWLWLHRRWPE